MIELLKSAHPRAVVAELKAAGPLRLLLGIIGIAVLLYGSVRIIQDSKHTKPVQLIKWMVGGVLVHDAILAPLTVAVGWLLVRYVRPRARPFVQSGLAIAATITLFALPLIHRQGKSAPGTTLVRQNYVGNLLIILAVVAGVTTAGYLARVTREHRRAPRPPTTPSRPEPPSED